MIFFDTETCGLVGTIVLLQWSRDNDEYIRLESVWSQKIKDVIQLLEIIIHEPDGVVGFNLSFDWFHLQKMYSILRLMSKTGEVLLNCLDEYVVNEMKGCDGPCCKPNKACDLMLHARRTEYQSTMDRKDIRIKKIPNMLAYQLAEELEKRIPLKDIYFSRRKKNLDGKRWKIEDNKDSNFKDIILRFAASSALKALSIDALGLNPDKTLVYSDVGPEIVPDELSYAPFSAVIKSNKSWPKLIHHYVNYWENNKTARQYASDDVTYTRKLYHYFKCPELGDDDSELACMVGSCRWKGYKIDVDKIKELRDEIEKNLIEGEHVPTAPIQVLNYFKEVMQPEEKIGLVSSNKKTLEELITNPIWENHPVRERARKVIEARDMKYDIDIYNKLLVAGRLHPDFKVGGTLSGRMSGGTERENKRGKKGSLNPQGFKKNVKTRSCFPLAFEGYNLVGGDMESFEVALAAASYQDEDLTNDLLKCWMCGYRYKLTELMVTICPGCGQSEGKENTRTKIHGLFGMELFPGKTYIEVRQSKGQKIDMYDLGKRGVFSTIYGGNENTLEERLQIPIEIGKRAIEGFMQKYKGVGKAQKKIYDQFCSMRQPFGIGTKVTWNDPADYVESMLGYRRYFTLENKICKVLYELANNLPKSWKEIKIPVVRRDRVQMVGGAVQSALYAAAFAIQSQAMRAAGNHQIQSTGAQITKHLQRKIWDLQPAGISDWVVQPFQVHDEVMVPTRPDYVSRVRDVVKTTVEEYREIVPLIAIGWKENINTWAEK